MSKVKVQFANDSIRLDLPIDEAVKCALDISEELSLYVERIELGTPLIKLGGMKVIEDLIGRLRAKNYVSRYVVADMKTLDGGESEALMATHAGARAIMVSSHASLATIKEAHVWTKHEGVELMVELDTELPNIYKRASEVTRLGAESLEFHVGLDLQAKGRSPTTVRNMRLIRKLCRLNTLAVAGGINPDKAEVLLREAPVDILVVGKWLYGAENPKERAIELHKRIEAVA